jgi:hypothetical protein
MLCGGAEQMLNWKEENFFLSCYCFVFLLSSALCEEQRSVGVMWLVWASVVCMCTRAEERWMQTWNVWVERGGWMSLHGNKQGRLSGGCVVTVCAVMKMFSKLCNYISNYYYYYYYYHQSSSFSSSSDMCLMNPEPVPVSSMSGLNHLPVFRYVNCRKSQPAQLRCLFVVRVSAYISAT